MLTVLHAGMDFGVTACQCAPSSSDTCTQPIVRPHPQLARAQRRLRQRKDGVVVLDAGDVLGQRAAGWALLGLVVQGQVRADDPSSSLPRRLISTRLRMPRRAHPDRRREHQRGGPIEAVGELGGGVARIVRWGPG